MTYYERHLPHWHPPGRAIFITWRLYGSLPAGFVVPSTTHQQGRKFVYVDRLLDRGAGGPLWLKREPLARMTADALKSGESRLALYRLISWVVMANHVHLLIEPRAHLRRITRTLKVYVARRANAMLGRKGQRFWQD